MTEVYNKAPSAKDKEMKKLFKQAGDLIGTLNKVDFGAPRSLYDMLGHYNNFDRVVSAAGALGIVSKTADELALNAY